jgi:hypothetical protein
VIFGANSAGKSSLGHLLLALKQTALSTDRKRALHLGDGNSLIDLGTFEDCLHGHCLLPRERSCSWTTRPLQRFTGHSKAGFCVTYTTKPTYRQSERRNKSALSVVGVPLERDPP